jgi:hypothetical protein
MNLNKVDIDFIKAIKKQALEKASKLNDMAFVEESRLVGYMQCCDDILARYDRWKED